MGKRVQRLALKNLASKVLNLGYVGENEHTQIVIDCSEVLWDYEDAVTSVVVQPPRGDMYPVEVTRDEDSIIWEIADSDLVYSGTGRVQITFTNDGEIVKSAIGNTKIEPSIMATGTAPTPLENWMERAEETARQMAQDAADATVEDLAEEKEAAIADIQAQETETETAIAQAAADARASIPSDYTQLSDDVTELKSAFEQLDANVITESAGPASIVSIADGADGMPMRKVEVAIEPVQDLHGYDAPWPAGGGKNVFDATQLLDQSAWNVITLNVKAGTQYTASTNKPNSNGLLLYINNTGESGGDGTNSIYDGHSVTVTSTAEGKLYIAQRATSSATGVFADYKYQVEEGPSATTWTPYSNVCPITGWTGAKVTRTGKNLFDIEKCRSDTITVVDGVMSGTASNFSRNFANENSLFLFEQDVGRVVLSFDAKTDANQGETGQGLVFNINYTDGSRTRTSIPNSTTTYTRFTLASEANKIVSRINVTYSTLGSNIWYLKDLQLEIGSTASDYEPYLGHTYEVAFPADPGTVYGGTLDVVSGKLVVDRASVTLNGSDGESYTNVSSANGARIAIPISNDSIAWTDQSAITRKLWCDTFKEMSNSSTFGGAIGIHYRTNGTHSIIISFGKLIPSDNIYAGAKAWFAQNPTTIVYALAETKEYTLTPTEIKTLLGINQVFADCGDTAITYPVDTKTYIDNRINSTRRLIAGIETGFTASKLYAVGDMLIIGDDLYKVTAQIASGATITVGTNVVKTTVAEQLLALANA